MADSDVKLKIREKIWNEMEEKGISRFPKPIKGRIPNFSGSKNAAQKFTELKEFKESNRVKVNPDSPQNPVRAKVIEKGKILYMPTPRLRKGFLRIEPSGVPPGEERKATTIKHSDKFGKKVDLVDIEKISLVVAGSVAVTKEGGRLGKGGGYSDLEYAILKELDLGDPIVITTVHPIQIVEEVPMHKHDVPIDYIITPDRIIKTDRKFEKPKSIDWSLLPEKALNEIPILRELK